MKGRDIALARILAGTLKVEVHPDTGVRVYGFHTKNKRWYEIRQQPHPKSGRRRVNIGPRRQPVYMNVLVWMFVNRRLPDGNVDHRDGDRLNDYPANLRTHSQAESDRQGFAAQQDAALRSCLAFFGYIAFWGEDPPAGIPVPDWYADWEPGRCSTPT